MQRRHPRLGGLDHLYAKRIYIYKGVEDAAGRRPLFDSLASESVREYWRLGQNTGKLHRGTNHGQDCQVHCHCAKMNSTRITGSNTTVITTLADEYTLPVPNFAAARRNYWLRRVLFTLASQGFSYLIAWDLDKLYSQRRTFSKLYSCESLL